MSNENSINSVAAEFKVRPTPSTGRKCWISFMMDDGSVFEMVPYDNPFAIEEDWRRLQGEPIDAPFLDYDWTCHLFKAIDYTSGLTPYFICIYDEDEMVAIFPLMKKLVCGVSGLCWLAQNVNAYNGPLISPSFLIRLTPLNVDDLWNKIISLTGSIDYLYLAKQTEKLGIYRNPFFLYHFHPFSAQSHCFDLSGDWESFYCRKLKSKDRRNFKRKSQRLMDLGTVSFEKAKLPEEKQRDIENVLTWKSAQLDRRGAPNPIADPNFRKMFDFNGTDLLEKPIIQTYSLKLSGQPIAAAFGLRTKDRFIEYQMAMREHHALKFSPGALLNKFIIEDNLTFGCKLFDLSIGDDPYKFKWADQHSNISQSLRAITLRGQIFVLAVKCKTGLKRFIKAQPILMHVVQYLIFIWTRFKTFFGCRKISG